jgi:hypothetical protein
LTAANFTPCTCVPGGAEAVTAKPVSPAIVAVLSRTVIPSVGCQFVPWNRTSSKMDGLICAATAVTVADTSSARS